MAADIGPRIGIDGEAEFRKELNNLTQQVKTFGAELKAVSTSADDEADAVSKAAKQQEILGNAIQAQNQKITQLREGLDQAVKKWGEADTNTLKWRQSLANAEATLNGLKSQLAEVSASMEETSVSAEDMARAMEQAAQADFENKINNLTQQVKTFGAELKAVSTAVDSEGNAVQDAARQHDILEKAVEAQTKKYQALYIQLQKAKNEFGDTSNETLDLRQAVARAETELNQLESQLKQTTTALNKTDKAADDLGDSMKNAGKKSSSFGDMLKANLSASAITGFASSITGAISGIISGLGQMVEESREYQRIMGSLEISSEKAGYTAKETSAAYNELFGVLGDNQTAATTTANLQALGLAQSDLNTLIDGTIGAWATYGDSIPIDGLAEAINETVQTGQVTGSLADMLNWAGTSEEAFNQKLAACSTEGERANLILQEMANQGLTQAGQAWQEQNAELVAANEATALYQQNAAALSETIGPLFTAIQTAGAQLLGVLAQIAGAFDFTAIGQQITNLTTWFGGLVTSVQSGQMTIGEAANEIYTAIYTKVSEALSYIGENLPQFLQSGLDIVSNIMAGVAENLPLVLQGVTDLITGAITAIGENLPNFLTKGMEIVTNLVQGVLESLPEIIRSAGEAALSFITEIGNNLPEILQKGLEMVGELVAGVIDSIPDIISAAGDVVSNFWDEIKNTDWLQLGKDILTGIGNGITSAVGTVVNAARDAAGRIFDTVAGWFGIHSPSTVMRDMIGKNMMQGWANGIRGGIHNTVGAMQSASRQVYGAIGGQLPAYATASAPGASGLSGLQIVLNDGTLVGKLSPAINRTLGGYTKMQGRYKVSV